jgi:transposase, IS6 family
VINWVQKFGPLLAEEARRRARQATGHWWVDETYLRVAGRWGYLYRAVDGRGQVIGAPWVRWRLRRLVSLTV